MASTPADRISGAPISWGVCEVPDWGLQLPAERVLGDMRTLGLTATEFGPDGFLPDEPQAKSDLLARHGLRAVGGFVPVVLHDPGHDPLAEVDRFIDDCLATGASVVVLAASTGVDGYDTRPELDDVQWKTLLDQLDRIDDHARERGVVAALHAHIGTMIETADEVQRVLDGSRIGLCIDTGHLVAAGADPVAIASANPARVRHVHLKDVDADLAARVETSELAFSDAVAQGLWVVLGTGSVDIRAMITALERHGYTGWYVLEQDLMLADEPSGEGPMAQVRQCMEFVTDVLQECEQA